MTSKLVVNTIESDTGISSVSFASSISMSSTSKFFFGAAGIDIGADTNINRPASGVLGFNINSSEKVRITSDGKIGINTISPTYGMHLHGTTASSNAYYYAEQSTAGASAGFRLKTTGSHFAIYGATSGSALGIYDYNAGAERFTIDSSGRVLIGTTTEGEGTADDLTIATSGTTGITIRSGTSGEGNIFFSDGTSGAAEYAVTIQYSHASNYMLFFVNAAERLRIDSSGKIGISRTATQHPLEIGHASEPTVSFWRGSTKSAALQAQSAGTYLMSYEDAPLFFSVASGSGYTERLRISSTGQLGVSHNLSGTSAYNRLMLHNPHDGSCWIQMTSTASGNAANTDGFSIGMNSSNVGHVWLRENAKMMFATNGTSRMEISADGYITNSSQPVFGGYGFAGAGSTLQTSIPAFKFSTVTVNQGSHFNNSTGIFTCPVAGKYLVLACFAAKADAFQWSCLYILKNVSTMSDNWYPPAINTTSVFNGAHFTYAPLFSGSVYNCAANDTLVMGYHSSYSAPNNSSRNSLFIMLVG